MSFLDLLSRRGPRITPAANTNRPKTAKTRLIAGSAAAALAVTTVGGFESLRTKAYLPTPDDVPTICYGATKGVKLGDVSTKLECDERLVRELQVYEAGMRKCLTEPDRWSDKTYVAMISVTYNIGEGPKGFCGSSMARFLNAGDGPAACDALLRWNKQAGKVLRGLSNRRAAERKLCLEGLQ